MNKESNLYTIVYSVIIVVIVAVTLALAFETFSPMQARNIAIDKIRHILLSINVPSTSSNAEELYEKYIVDSYLVNSQGERVLGNAFKIEIKDEFSKPVAERKYPVFEAIIDGNKKYILSMHGSGLWGAIWGYISLDENKNTVYCAAFDHEGETPGLGDAISKTKFGHEFMGKNFFDADDKFVSIAVVKQGKSAHGQDYVDGISGGTITSRAVNDMLKSSIGEYEMFLKKK